MVLAEVWRQLDGVDALSGPHGAPLSRTVKLLLDPLVIRPVQHPECAGPMLTPDGETLLATLINAARDRLEATAAWFTKLKQVRRSLRITDGNPQDLYFQVSFELATMHGPPDPSVGDEIATAALRDVHESAAGRTTSALKEYVTDPERARKLTSLIDIAWKRRPPTRALSAEQSRHIRDVLETCPTGDDSDAFDELVASHAGTRSGIRLWTERDARRCARDLGLTAYPLPRAPGLGSTASKAALGLPFDRTIQERVFTALQTSSDRAELPPIPELVTDEIARSCSPWAILDETIRVAATVGAALALELSPFGNAADDDGHTAAHRAINRRWRREAYVLRARRLALSADATDLPSENPLAYLAAELQTPSRSYVRRLWVRLHGRDVRGAPIYTLDELWDLLDGVARSVILDHRARVKQALSTVPPADASAIAEEWAS